MGPAWGGTFVKDECAFLNSSCKLQCHFKNNIFVVMSDKRATTYYLFLRPGVSANKKLYYAVEILPYNCSLGTQTHHACIVSSVLRSNVSGLFQPAYIRAP